MCRCAAGSPARPGWWASGRALLRPGRDVLLRPARWSATGGRRPAGVVTAAAVQQARPRRTYGWWLPAPPSSLSDLPGGVSTMRTVVGHHVDDQRIASVLRHVHATTKLNWEGIQNGTLSWGTRRPVRWACWTSGLLWQRDTAIGLVLRNDHAPEIRAGAPLAQQERKPSADGRLDDRLSAHRAAMTPDATPVGLLPIGAVTLAALAVQAHRWDLAVESDYLFPSAARGRGAASAVAEGAAHGPPRGCRSSPGGLRPSLCGDLGLALRAWPSVTLSRRCAGRGRQARRGWLRAAPGTAELRVGGWARVPRSGGVGACLGVPRDGWAGGRGRRGATGWPGRVVPVTGGRVGRGRCRAWW